MAVFVSKGTELQGLLLGAIEIVGAEVIPSSVELRAWSDEVAQQVSQAAESSEQDSLRQQIRQMLRHGKFKASGRSKPAQEYLLRCATHDRVLPNINAPVDILNTVSLHCGLPISLLSISKCSQRLHARYGVAGETFVFNSAGQELDVEDLVVVCAESQGSSRPVGSPIKDSMAGKIEVGDQHLIAIVYAPRGESDRLLRTCESLAATFTQYCPSCKCAMVSVED